MSRNWRRPGRRHRAGTPPGKPSLAERRRRRAARGVQTIVGRRRRAEADGVDAYPPVGGLLCARVERVDAAGVGAVGEQHDDVRHVSPSPGVRRLLVASSTSMQRRSRPAPRRGSRPRWRRSLSASRRRSTVPRAVVRLSMTSISASLSVVGGTTNSAKPGEGDDADARALHLVLHEGAGRVLGDGSRLGSTSVAHIERETSRARMIEVRPSGTSTAICGRAVANASTARLARNSATGTCRRQRDRRGSAARISATLEKRTACARRRRSCHRYTPSSSGTTSRSSRARGAGEGHRYTSLPEPQRATARRRRAAGRTLMPVTSAGDLRRLGLRTSAAGRSWS